MKKLQAAKPKHELKMAKSCDNHLWVNHFKPYYKKKAYIFCCGEIFYCDYQSHLRRAIAQSAISHAYAASYWALLHTRLHLHHTCKHKDLYVQYTNPHTHTNLPISTGPPTYPLHHLPKHSLRLRTVSHSDYQSNRNSQAF